MSEAPDEAELARYQAALLEALHEADAPSEVMARLRARDDLRGMHEAVHHFEERAVEIGMKLVRLWGERRVERPSGRMRAVRFEGAGKPLMHRLLPIPTPGPGEVRIRVRASGVCGTDVHMVEGSFRVPTPIIPGHEPVGEVDALGEGVTTLHLGQRVGVAWVQAGCGVCLACLEASPHRCMRPRTWMHHGGGHAEWMLADARGCVPLPEGLAYEAAAPLFCAGYTVMSGYRRALAKPQERVAVLGLGGLGHLAVQIARAHGHPVIAITQSEAKREEALALGASEVLVVQKHAGHELMAMGGVHVLLATSSDLAQTRDATLGLLPEGRLVMMGLASRAPMELTLDPILMMGRGLTVIGGKQGPREDLDALLALAAKGTVQAMIEVQPFALIARAMQRLAEQRIRYRAVLVHEAS
jgi:D-arabinose 1-dehydrogenase-like Zn-dependent alcohol dehydrogenase